MQKEVANAVGVHPFIDGMLTKTKFQTFFEQNIVTK
jgi:hypothetical protein